MKKIFKFIASIFTGFNAKQKKSISDAIEIVERIKLYIDSPMVDVFTTIIPGDLDNRSVALLRNELPKILTGLRLVENGDLNTAFVNLNNMDIKYKREFLDALAVQIALVLADGRITWSELKTVTKWVYDNSK